MTEHNIFPIFDQNSKILILGSFPSVKSREARFFYHHPQNRFWRVLAQVLKCPEPQTIDEKKELLLSHGIALWDVIKSCDIDGSSDSSIRNVSVNDIGMILSSAPIKRIFVNGATAEKLYKKHCVGLPAPIRLPSTSSANAAFSLSRLVGEWSVIADYLI